MQYNADLTPTRPGIFRAVLRTPSLAVESANGEHDLAHEMVRRGLPDGAIQFWRDGTTRSLRFRSIHKAAEYRVALGNDFPQLVRRRAGQIPFGSSGQVTEDGDFAECRPTALARGDRAQRAAPATMHREQP